MMDRVEFAFGSIDRRDRLLVGVGDEWFCRITIKASNQRGDFVLADFNWDAKEIFNWFERSQEPICMEERPEWCMESTIAGSVELAFESDEVDDELSDEIYNYRLMHDLRFAVRGANIPSIYFGCGVSGGEVSAVVGGRLISVSVDFSTFYFGLEVQRKYVSERVKNNYLEM